MLHKNIHLKVQAGYGMYSKPQCKIEEWAPLSADETVTRVTKLINGGTNGLQARKDAYAKAKTILK